MFDVPKLPKELLWVVQMPETKPLLKEVDLPIFLILFISYNFLFVQPAIISIVALKRAMQMQSKGVIFSTLLTMPDSS